MHIEVGNHLCAPVLGLSAGVVPPIPPPSVGNPDISATPYRLYSLRHTDKPILLKYQAPVGITSYGYASYPYVCAVEVKRGGVLDWVDALIEEGGSLVDSYDPALPLVVQHRVYNGTYLFLGEESLEGYDTLDNVKFSDVSDFSPEDAAAIAAHLGKLLSALHYKIQIDAMGFSVLRGRMYNEDTTQTYVTLNYDLSRKLNLDLDPEVAEHLGYVLGRMATTPSPTQGKIFTAFSSAYIAGAREAGVESIARKVIASIRDYVE